jgi:HSP20 family molecular chaperone IbpA
MVTAYKKPVYRHFNLHDNGHKLPVNILEGDNRFIIEMAVPGFDKSEISISLEGGKLTVKGQKSPDNEIKYLRREWTASNFERSLILKKQKPRQCQVCSGLWCLRRKKKHLIQLL